jgi:ABC-type nitrate/sulfonate/bicarbonate transport system substrate-binding protein
MSRRISHLLASILLLALVGCARDRPVAVEIGIAIPSWVHAVAWIAEDEQLFPDAMPVTVNLMGGSAATMRALIAGSIDVGIAGGDAAIKANAAGADLVIVAGLVNRYYHRLIGGREIDSGAALVGGRIGLPFLGGPQAMAVDAALAQLGLSRADVELLSLGRDFNRMVALSRGDIDATTAALPGRLVEQQGFHVLADLPASGAAFPYAMVITTRERLETDPASIKATLRGLCRAVGYYRAPANRADAIDRVSARLGLTEADDPVTRFDETGPGLLAWPPLPDRQGLAQVAAQLDGPDATIDLELLHALQAEGECR